MFTTPFLLHFIHEYLDNICFQFNASVLKTNTIQATYNTRNYWYLCEKWHQKNLKVILFIERKKECSLRSIEM